MCSRMIWFIGAGKHHNVLGELKIHIQVYLDIRCMNDHWMGMVSHLGADDNTLATSLANAVHLLILRRAL